MRTIFVKNLIPDYRNLKSDAKFKQMLLQVCQRCPMHNCMHLVFVSTVFLNFAHQHIGSLRDQLLEAHLVFFQVRPVDRCRYDLLKFAAICCSFLWFHELHHVM